MPILKANPQAVATGGALAVGADGPVARVLAVLAQVAPVGRAAMIVDLAPVVEIAIAVAPAPVDNAAPVARPIVTATASRVRRRSPCGR